MTSPEVRIDRLDGAVAGELLTVRRAAFVSEAQLYDDPHIPPLTQTLDELRADLGDPSVVTI
ncbi:MAG TPA: GNAT family N-acetyltransferase, partial [Actinotalea sp.]|nr:GNAT family N-acetyltransferase [Actinotalea sp.]